MKTVEDRRPAQSTLQDRSIRNPENEENVLIDQRQFQGQPAPGYANFTAQNSPLDQNGRRDDQVD